jgi:hypothetical protein
LIDAQTNRLDQIKQHPGHKLYIGWTGGAHCSCNAWHWPLQGDDLQGAYNKHIESEAKREAALIQEIEKSGKSLLNLPTWASKILQVVATIAVFSLLMFVVMHFVG